MSESLSAIYLSFNERQKKNHKKTGHGVLFYNLAKLFQVAFKTEQINPKLVCVHVCLCTQAHSGLCMSCAWEEGHKTTQHLQLVAEGSARTSPSLQGKGGS